MNKVKDLIIHRIKHLYNITKNIIQEEWKIEKRAIIAAFLNGVCGRIIQILNVLLVGILIDLITKQSDLNTILVVVGIWSVLIVSLGIIEHTATQFQIAYGFKIGNIFRLNLERKFLEMDYAHTEDVDVLDKKSTAIDAMWSYLDIDYILLNEIVGAFLSFGVTASIMISIRAEVFIVIFIIILIEIWLHSREIKNIHKFEQEESIKRRGVKYTCETMQHLGIGKEVRAYSAQQYLESTYCKYYNNLRKVISEKVRYIMKIDSVYSVLKLIKVILLYGVAVYEFSRGNVTIGSFAIYVGAIQLFAESLKQMLSSFNELIGITMYYDTYQEFMNIPENMTVSGTKDLENSKQEGIRIEFQDVWFKYPNQENYTLKGINLSIEPYEKVALIGENGSGKTTLVKLLLRLYEPESGKILVNGVDIQTYTYISYMKLFAPVFQDFKLFAYTLKENIAFDKEVTDDEVYKCLDEVDLEQKIRSYSKGLNSYLTKEFSEEGIDLSGGEKQRLAIAKATFKNAVIAVLDEPTAAIDPISENRIYKKVRYLFDKNAILYISHRMSSVTFCDKIIILDKGEINEMGTYSELINKKGMFWDMYEKQREKYII
ncbi:MAG: ABC transporter ATP-binding protein [Romboutsia sp.]